jgi:autophagy-related protein 2
VSIKIVDGSVRVFAPNLPGSLVTHIEELAFATDVVGDSCDSSFHINASSLSMLALDDFIRQEPFTDSKRTLRGVSAWTVRHIFLFVRKLIFCRLQDTLSS